MANKPKITLKYMLLYLDYLQAVITTAFSDSDLANKAYSLLASLQMFIAAFTSLSCLMPHCGQTHFRIESFFTSLLR